MLTITLKHQQIYLQLNDIGSCNLSVDRPVAFDIYQQNRSTGSFILIDPETNATAAAGMIRYQRGVAKTFTGRHWI